MHRKSILALLNKYETTFTEEETFRKETILFIENEPQCFERSLLKGHITGSAMVVNEVFTKTALVLHAKLGKWLQPGGHADGDANIMEVALKEAFEETGLKQLKVLPEILDIDIHTIPERKGVPEHLHYDIRFAIIANDLEPFLISDESADIQWISLENVANFNSEKSIERMVTKLIIKRNLL
jgi:8-oxo-dGTP pyrophosphatase MutT (NUDIX family)